MPSKWNLGIFLVSVESAMTLECLMGVGRMFCPFQPLPHLSAGRTAINGRKGCHQLIGVCILCFMLSSSLGSLHTAFCQPHLSCTMLMSFNLCSTICQIVQKSFGCLPSHMMYRLCRVVCKKHLHTVASLCHVVCHVVSRLCPAVIKKLLHTVASLCCVMRQAIKHLHTVDSLYFVIGFNHGLLGLAENPARGTGFWSQNTEDVALWWGRPSNTSTQ